MSDQLKRARLVPYDEKGKQLVSSEAIALDFNPESLSLKVQAGTEADRGRQGKQQVQFVGDTSATLSFEAMFDTTRPNRNSSGAGDADVRRKTARIVRLLQTEEGKKRSAPRRVRFWWGTIIFDGVIKSFSETLDFFSPDGVPLRSKVSLSITEQSFRYKARASQGGGAPHGGPGGPGTDAAQTAGGPGGTASGTGTPEAKATPLAENVAAQTAGASPAAPPPAEEFGFEPGAGTDLSGIAGAGATLTAGAAVELFGNALFEATFDAEVDLGLTAKASGSVDAGIDQRIRSPWAKDGPRPGTRTAMLAARVNQARAAGKAYQAEGLGAFESSLGGAAPETPGSGAATPGRGRERRAALKQLPVRGSPPTNANTFGPPPRAGIFNPPVPPRVSSHADRPSWERLSAGRAPRPDHLDSIRKDCRCGCKRW